MTAHFHLAAVLRMSSAVVHVPHTPSFYGQGQLRLSILNTDSFRGTRRRKVFQEIIDVIIQIVCFVDRASLYNLVNKANFAHSVS